MIRTSHDVALFADQRFDAILAALEPKISGVKDKASEFSAGPEFWPPAGHWMQQYRPYIVRKGVLQIPVKGILLNEFPYAAPWGATGYEYISEAILRGRSDPDVESIALMVDSPGGYVTGCFEVTDEIYAARSDKPIVAYVADSGYSAAYAIASAANEIAVSRTGGVGSVGVLTTHVDLSGLYERSGVVLTYIYAGKHKVDGNETEPLPDDVKARIEERLAAIYDVFVGTVARNRAMPEEAVRATEALTYPAKQAVGVGFADRIGTYADAVSAEEWGNDAPDDDEEEQDMAQSQATTTESAPKATVDTAAIAAAAEEATVAERNRISAILTSDEAKTRPIAAQQAAFTLALPADKAKAFLAAMPEEKAAATTTGAGAPAGMFATAMDATGGAGLSAQAPKAADLANQRENDTLAYIRGLRGDAA